LKKLVVKKLKVIFAKGMNPRGGGRARERGARKGNHSRRKYTSL